MKTLLLILLAASAAHALKDGESVWDLYTSCDISAGYFLNAGSGTPRKDCEYPLGNVVVLQKVNGMDGYLLRPDYELGDTGRDVMFFQTKVDIPDNMRFNGEIKVRWIGTLDYSGLDGFKKTVWAFAPAAKGAR